MKLVQNTSLVDMRLPRFHFLDVFMCKSELCMADPNNPLYWDTSDFIPYAVLAVITLR